MAMGPKGRENRIRTTVVRPRSVLPLVVTIDDNVPRLNFHDDFSMVVRYILAM